MSSDIILLFVLLLKIYCFLSGVSCLKSSTMEQNPEVESKWETENTLGYLIEGVDNGDGVNFAGDTIIASPIVSELIITCSAHYPIQWTYKLTEVMDFTSDDYYTPIAMTSLRTSEDFHDKKTYKFYAYLRVRGSSNKITGEYKCSSTGNETLSVSRYIYWQGSESMSLLLAEPDEDEDSYSYRPCTTNRCLGKSSQTVMADVENKTIVIPCAVSYPSANISLSKDKDDLQNNFQEIKWRNETGISFDPKIGFTLQVQELLFSPYGIYKCNGDQEADFLIVKVAEGLQKPETTLKDLAVNNTLIPPAKFSYDDKTRTIVCCSSGARAPRIYSSPCRSHDSISLSKNCENIKIKLKDFKLFNRGTTEHMHCRKFTVTDSEGMFRCFGPGIDIIRRYFIPPTNSTLIYFDDEIPKVSKENLIQISPTHGNIYSGYSNINSTLECHPAASLFSYGIRWSILWKNGTEELYPDVPTYSNHQPGRSTTLKLIPDTNMAGAICHAPLLKSLEWVDRKIQFNITEPVAPVFSGPDVEEYSISSLPFTFTCQVERGNPTPEIEWNVPTDIIPTKKEAYGSNNIKSLTINIMVDKPYLFGDYGCSASNIAGSSKKTFRIIKSVTTTTTSTTPPSTTDEFPVTVSNARINEPPDGQGWTTFEIILTVLICVILLVGVGGFIVLKRRQRKLEEQRSLSFRELRRDENISL